jgi:hypothetical protein
VEEKAAITITTKPTADLVVAAVNKRLYNLGPQAKVMQAELLMMQVEFMALVGVAVLDHRAETEL